MSNKKLPKHVVDVWPEVLKDVDIQVIPIEYLQSIRVHFTDGKVWDIDIRESSKKRPDLDIEGAIEDIMRDYQDVIENVDFRLETNRIKEDIQKRTYQFMKKRK